jgi:hypothetical protein
VDWRALELGKIEIKPVRTAGLKKRLVKLMVGVKGFEPSTPTSRTASLNRPITAPEFSRF